MNNKFDELTRILAQRVTIRATPMKRFLLCVGGLLVAGNISAVQTIYQWTFEGHAIAPTTATSYGYFPPEIGADGAFICAHVFIPPPIRITVFSGPVGNGSSQSFGANNWADGDFYMFVINTVGKTNLQLSWDQISSSDGPGLFRLQYSLEVGGAWTDIGSDYSVLANAGANTWNSSTYVAASHYFVDLSSISALNNQPTVHFRLVAVGTNSAGGGSITIAGMNQVDNFTVAVPEPADLDSDDDGISDALDQCPDTPPGAIVDANGCSIDQLDSDHDGILNDLDQCPDTPPGAIVDAYGCSIQQLCPCDGPWKNHGEYVRHVADVASQFLKDGRISDSQRSSILENAAASDCGKRN